MREPPQHVLDLVGEREAARARKDFDTSDALRERIRAAGYLVLDTPTGTSLEPAPAFTAVDPGSLADRSREPATLALSVHVLYEGFLGDLERFLGAWSASAPEWCEHEVIVVDNASPDGEEVERLTAGFTQARCLHLDRPQGWASARNAGLKTSAGGLIVLADLSVEPVGDIVTPLLAAFEDPTVGVAGPFGLVTEDMREFVADPGPEVHAIEGYLMAISRRHLSAELIREAFTWYRNADLDLSFQIRAAGARALAVSLPVRKHQHRGWEAVSEPERTRLSRKNHALFHRRWRGRPDLTARRP